MIQQYFSSAGSTHNFLLFYISKHYGRDHTFEVSGVFGALWEFEEVVDSHAIVLLHCIALELLFLSHFYSV